MGLSLSGLTLSNNFSSWVALSGLTLSNYFSSWVSFSGLTLSNYLAGWNSILTLVEGGLIRQPTLRGDQIRQDQSIFVAQKWEPIVNTSKKGNEKWNIPSLHKSGNKGQITGNERYIGESRTV